MASSQSHSPPQLLRVLGVIFGLAVVVGGVIGSGIMRAPGVVAQGVQDPLLMLAVWAVGGLAAMLAAMPRGQLLRAGIHREAGAPRNILCL